EIFCAVVDRMVMPVRPTCRDLTCSVGLSERFEVLIDRLSPTIPQLDEARKCYPLVWFEVRSRDRCWTDQINGIVSIATEIKREYPRTGIIIAGWSKLTDEAVSPYDKMMIRRDNAIAEDIDSKLDPSIPVFNITGIPTIEKAAWSREIVASVSVYSSGVVFTVGVARKPGVLMTCHDLYGRAVQMASGKGEFPVINGTYVVDDA